MRYVYLLLFLMSGGVMADVMNLNNFMPTQLDDASPIDEKTFDVQYSGALVESDKDTFLQQPNLRYGVSKNLQLETQALLKSGGDESHGGETQLGFQYRFNKSDGLLPQVSLSPMAIFPTGKGTAGADYFLKLNLTSTLLGTSDHPVAQLHFNYKVTHNQNATSGERSDASTYILGASYQAVKGTAIIIDTLAQNEIRKKENSFLTELGLHQDLGNQYYLGLSYGQGYGSSSTLRRMILGLEKQFP